MLLSFSHYSIKTAVALSDFPKDYIIVHKPNKLWGYEISIKSADQFG